MLNWWHTLLNIYGKFMHLKLFIDTMNHNLVDEYINAINKHNNKVINNDNMIDAGFDIFTAASQALTNQNINKVDFNVVCACQMVTKNETYNTGFYMYPRSSISKTPLRLANNVGIIDAGYRGNLIGMIDCISSNNSSNSSGGSASTENNAYTMGQFTRLLQICAPSLMPIFVEIVDDVEQLGPSTSRGGGGIGSTGV